MSEKIVCSMVNHGLGITWQGVLTPCCQWYPDHGLEHLSYKWTDYQGYNDVVRRTILSEFEQGIEHTGCRKCFQEEKHGYFSLRQRANRMHPQTHEEPSVDNPIYNFELRLSNHCNLKCVMCGPYASTSWYQEMTKHADKFNNLIDRNGKPIIHLIPQPDDWSETEEFRSWLTKLLTQGQVKVLDFSGGEPFSLPSTQWILQTLLDNGVTDVHIQANSNYTRIPPRLVSLLKNFKNLFLSISLEGIGAHNDWLRYPSDWSEIEANITMMTREVPARYNVNHTFQHASAYSLPTLVDWCLERKLDLRLTMATGRPCLTMESCPPADLARLTELINANGRLREEPVYGIWGKHLLDFVNSVSSSTMFDRTLYEEYRKFIDTLDNIRGTNYNSVFQPSAV